MKIIKCKDKNEASKKALELILQIIDKNTLLLLSGGTSPDLLYRLMVQERIRPGAVAMIDERYGLPMHENSNEKMIFNSGLADYINKEGIPFHKILTGADMEETTKHYEQIIRDLFKKFSRKVAVMGIGSDGHTAGIKPGLEINPAKLVVSFDDINGPFGKRITLTFKALAQIDEFIVLSFGENKRLALRKMSTERDKNLIPAVFYTECSGKVTLLTDCEVGY